MQCSSPTLSPDPAMLLAHSGRCLSMTFRLLLVCQYGNFLHIGIITYAQDSTVAVPYLFTRNQEWGDDNDDDDDDDDRRVL